MKTNKFGIPLGLKRADRDAAYQQLYKELAPLSVSDIMARFSGVSYESAKNIQYRARTSQPEYAPTTSQLYVNPFGISNRTQSGRRGQFGQMIDDTAYEDIYTMSDAELNQFITKAKANFKAQEKRLKESDLIDYNLQDIRNDYLEDTGGEDIFTGRFKDRDLKEKQASALLSVYKSDALFSVIGARAAATAENDLFGEDSKLTDAQKTDFWNTFHKLQRDLTGNEQAAEYEVRQYYYPKYGLNIIYAMWKNNFTFEEMKEKMEELHNLETRRREHANNIPFFPLAE